MTVAFDHLMVMVDDETPAGAVFETAGYAVTPRSELPGMANRLVCFRSAVPHAACFLELLAIHRRDEVPPPILSFLGDALGPAAITVAVPDIDTYCGWLSEIGIAFTGPIPIRRQWSLDNGEVLNVHLDIVLPEVSSDLIRWVVVKHHTVHHYLRDEFVRHANPHAHVAGVVIAADEPHALAAKLARIWQCEVMRRGQDAIVQLAGAPVLVERAGDAAGEAARSPAIVGLPMHQSDQLSHRVLESDSYDLLSISHK